MPKKDEWIYDLRNNKEALSAWNLHMRILFGRELAQMGVLLQILDTDRTEASEDKLIWKARKDDIFRVKSFHHAI